MKIKHLFVGLLAVAATVACKEEEILVTPELDLNKTAASVTADGGAVEFEVTSNVDWTADADQDWVSLDPQTGKGNAKVKATVAPNETEETRTATVTVKADKLTKTLKITQTGKEKGDEPTPPEPEKEEYLLVGDAVDCGWDPANGIVLTLTDGYYVAKEVGIQANKGMHFTKNEAWEGNVKGLHGLIAPNEIGEVGNNDIALTTGGAYDVYLAEALDKFYFMTPGKTPADAVEHVDIAVSWGMMGMFVGNEWGSDVPMEYEGDWVVAKGAEFSALTFKIRGNGSWSDATNIGVAPGSEKGVINGKISVVTAEYSKANLGGDAADIKLNGEAGVYDVYFNFENLEVYVMEPGYKPGEKDPQNPEPVDPSQISYTVVGTLNNINWDNAAAEGQMTYDGTYHVAQNVPFVWGSTLYGGAEQIEFKIVETGTWDGFGVAAGTEVQAANAEIAVVAGGDNICVAAAEGAYDVYLDAANGKVWVMTPGTKPGETPEPSYTLDHKQWMGEQDGLPLLIDLDLVEEGAMVVALPLMDNSGFGLYMYGTYEAVPADATSGVISFVQYDAEFGEFLPTVEIAYANLTAATVDITSEAIFGSTAPVTFTLVETPYDINLDAGGDGPSGEVENGVYWFIEPTNQKVMTPLAETSTYGRPAADDAIGGASTAKNAFTLTYNADFSCYTIQDSYGRYLYQDMKDDGVTPYRTISLATELPAAGDENMAFYMWTVYGNGDGTYDVYNSATYYSITYSPSYNNWEIYDPYESDFANLFPSLVKADNPVAEPEGPTALHTEWLFTTDAMSAYADTFGGTEGVASKEAGDGGMYVAANASGEGKISYVQIDKTELDADGKATRIVGGTGHPYVTGIWPGDYWLFEATDGTEYPAGTSVNISYITRTSKTGHKYWRLEYLDGEEWKPAMDVTDYTLNGEDIQYNIAMFDDGKKNVEVNATVTYSSPVKDVKFRMVCAGNGQSSNENPLEKPNGGTCRIAGAEGTSPVIKVVE